MAQASDTWADTWPELTSRGLAAPVRVGIDNRTMKVITGWAHVEQSIARLFRTRFHRRVLRRWLGSFVPHLLGELATYQNITRFYGAIATAIDLWEPCFRVEEVRLVNADGTDAQTNTVANRLRLGHITFRVTGVYMPRGHLGDFTPESRRSIFFRGTGTGSWERLEI
jgi:phage baseplate assembly protein W